MWRDLRQVNCAVFYFYWEKVGPQGDELHVKPPNDVLFMFHLFSCIKKDST